jgi:uncharacterized membrane protein YdjX (TVP38/TMEM64 family)
MRQVAFAVVIIAVLGAAAAWKWTPLADYLDPRVLIGHVRALQDLPLTPLWVLLAYVVGSLCVVPITLLVIVTGLAFAPAHAIAYALGGILLAAAVTFMIGAWLGRDAVRRFAGPRINTVSRQFAKGGILAVALIRLIPVAPFTVVNVVAGATHIRLRDFLLGTLLGEGPGTVLMIIFVHQLVGAIENPTLGAFSAALAVLIVLVWVGIALKKRLGHKS